MADTNAVNPSVSKKKAKKKKRKTGVKTELEIAEFSKEEEEPEDDFPSVSPEDETLIRTTKCSYCGKPVRQLVRGLRNIDFNHSIPVVCETCLKMMTQEEEKRVGVDRGGGNSTVSRNPPLKETLCNCVACCNKRENASTPEVDRDAHITQSYWMEIRHIVRCIYRDSMSLSDISTRENIGSEKMKAIVKKLCCRDPHQFFQRLETLAREYLLEVKVRLLEQLSCGFNSPQLAIEFIQMLLEEYSTLCAALPALLFLLEPLEETDYIRRLGVTIELVNKNIFRELIFAESFMNSNLPLIIAQLRLATLSSDPFHRNTADALSQRYISLDCEMEDIGNVWKSAKEQLKLQQDEAKQKEERRAHIEKIMSDGESFRKQTKREQQISELEYTTVAVQESSTTKTKEKPVSSVTIKSSNRELPNSRVPMLPSNSSSTSPSPPLITPDSTSLSSLIPSQPHDQNPSTEDKDGESWLSKEQVVEWSKILFKCIKPIGDPEFRITENIATHTITLKIDMTSLDLRHAESVCTREQVMKYEDLGMRREEIAEVALKLNAIKHLGINLRIDDLFDEHGFMIVDGSEVHEEREDAVYFVESGRNSIKGKEKIIEEEMSRSELIDLQQEKERVIKRENCDIGEGRETDLLQSMTMKIRFMKSVTSEEMRSRLISDSEQVMFESCDQVQMKLTQLELNTMRLMCGNTCLAANLGIRKRKPNETQMTTERFVHTDAHQPFVGLLLEQGKQVEQSKKTGDMTSQEEQETNSDKETVNVSRGKDRLKDQLSKLPEQVTGESSSVVVKSNVCIPSQTQACQCFACIGAVAAQQTEGISRPLNPVDLAGSKLTIKGTMTASLCEGKNKVSKSGEKETQTKKLSNKTEHLWQNWMSTSEVSQLEEEEEETTPSSNNETESDVKPPDPSVTSETTPNSSPCSSVTTSTTATSTTDEHTANSCALNKTTGDGNGPVRRYCPCCYCELFGQNAPPTAPTSHNYTKQRDKMRQKLEKKRSKLDCSEQHHHCHHVHGQHSHSHPHTHSHPHNHPPHHHHSISHPVQVQQTPVTTPTPPPPLSPPIVSVSQKKEKTLDELLRFIEGDDFEESSSTLSSSVLTTTSKGKKKKSKRKGNDSDSVFESSKDTPTNGATSNGGIIHLHHSRSESDPVVIKDKSGKKEEKLRTQQNEKESIAPVSSTVLKSNGRVSNSNISSKQSRGKTGKRSQSNGVTKSQPEHCSVENSVSVSDVDVDEDYDQELEEFKKLCFSSAPVESRKKIHVSLNMQDIISKLK